MEHPDWAAFVAAIVAKPDDDTARLVAADFLEENGDPDRAVFIRVQVELARLYPNPESTPTPEVQQLLAKARTFMGPFSNLSLWAAEECPELVKMRGGGRVAMTVEGAERLRWSRGFVSYVRCSVREWQHHGLTIRKRIPVEHLALTECDSLNVPDWLGMVPTLLGLSSLRYGWSPSLERLVWLRSLLPGVTITPLAC